VLAIVAPKVSLRFLKDWVTWFQEEEVLHANITSLQALITSTQAVTVRCWLKQAGNSVAEAMRPRHITRQCFKPHQRGWKVTLLSWHTK
jgi:hypothetical protein